MRRVTIEQATDGWRLTEENALGAPPLTFKTAAEAERFVRMVDGMTVRATGRSRATCITWFPADRVGRMVVNAIAGATDA